jgi:serine protease Do
VQPGGTLSFAEVAERAVDGVVNISATRGGGRTMMPFDPFGGPFGGPAGKQRSLGSGVIVTADGVVLTNNHVIEKAEEIKVVLHDGREIEAKVIGTDPGTDLAVLRLQGKPGGLKPVAIGDSTKMRLGDAVLAIGNPFGVGQTVTMGIVSAIGRSRLGIVDYEDFIQTDAAINPGNSGGALVNLRGELIGINTAILSRTGGYQGVGLAIPTRLVRPVMDSLLKNGKFVRGWMGVGIQQVDDSLAAGLKLPVTRGVLVSQVEPGSPAARAGLRRGDVIVSLGGKPMESSAEFRNTVATLGPGAAAELELYRDGKKMPLRVALGTQPDADDARVAGGGGKGSGNGGGGSAIGAGLLAGVQARPLTDDLRRRFRVDAGVTGVVVTDVAGDSPAASIGVQPGDVIMEVNGKAVTTPADLAKLGKAAGNNLVVLLHRQGSTVYLSLRR